MKKNAMLKIAAVVLVAVLLTTCAISSTFAKYVSDGMDYSETARVAKWGVEFNTTTTESDLLTIDDPNVKSSEDGVNVIAPGTSKSFTLDLTVTGTPEVAFQILLDSDKETDGIQTDYITVDDGLKQRLTWKYSIDGGAEEICEHDFGKVNTAIKNAAERSFTIGETTNYAKTITITWTWDFNTDADGDVADTGLGNDAAKVAPETAINRWVSFNAYGQIVQID